MATQRLADYLMTTLVEHGISQAFLVTGGGAMHLNDAIARADGMHYTCCHHEQACAMAAEGYARIAGKPALLNVTTGPGGINALNGVFGAWTDSVPMIVLSGQVKRETCRAATGDTALRQLGDQEADIVSMVKGITKFSAIVLDPSEIRYLIEKAITLANTGRPGPVWLDIPVDVQAALIDPETLKGFDPAELPPSPALKGAALSDAVSTVLARLAAAKRPVLFGGTGIRAAGAVSVFRRVADRLGIPVATAWTHDLIATDSPLFCGRPGSIGDRGGNFSVQNSDLVLILGSRLNIRQVSYNWKAFARCALKIQVDVDPAELEKPTVRPDLPVCADLLDFLTEMERQLDAPSVLSAPMSDHQEWREWARQRWLRYPCYLPERHVSHPGAINPYHFMHELFGVLEDGDAVVCGNATATIVTFQCARLQPNQRLISNSGSASMGHDLPAAIGVAVAMKGQRVICLAGDGSLQMNLQELQTMVQLGLPLKLIVLNNGGYLSMRLTQTNFFGLGIGADRHSGVSFPDFEKVGAAFGLDAVKLSGPEFTSELRAFLSRPGPGIAEVMLNPEQGFEPKLSSRKLDDGRMVSAPLEDMAPFLPRDEFRSNMIIPVQEF
jgi:acetolactate synthase-1/2/3 large subunit